MKSQNMLSQEDLKQRVHYDPETGIFTWKKSECRRIHVGQPSGHLTKMGYIHIRVSNGRYFAHRLAFLYMEGYLPENQVDHINRIRNDNRWCNLREVSCSCNRRNSVVKGTNKSGITGVFWSARHKKWVVSIKIKSNSIHLGHFAEKIDAAKARWDAEVKYGYPNCNSTSSAYQYMKEECQNKFKDGI